MGKANACSVPSAGYATIQSAIDDPKCEVIEVAAGAYKENLVIKRTLTLRGAGADTTAIDGCRAGVVIRITDGAAPAIEGFTITGGDGSADGGKGGGISIQGATATITKNVIADNYASTNLDTFGLGGGICVDSSTRPVVIRGNLIRDNVAFNVPMYSTVIEGKGSGNGGGIAVCAGAEAEIADNTIDGNLGYTRSDDTGFPYFGYTTGGGGIFSLGAKVTIVGNKVTKNRGGLQGSIGQGGGINIAAGVAVIEKNTIADNVGVVAGCFGQGGGVNGTAQFQSITLRGNKIMNNTAVVTGRSPMPNPFISSGGGGSHIYGGVAPEGHQVTVEENEYMGNKVSSTIVATGSSGALIGGGAGASYVATCRVVSFKRNKVHDNVAVENVFLGGPGAFGGSQGGGIVFQACGDVTVDGNEIRNNTCSKMLFSDGALSSNDGGGISVWRCHHSVITNNTVVGNTSVENATFRSDDPYGIYQPRGGGIYVSDAEVPDFDGAPLYDDSVVIKGNKVTGNLACGSVNVIGGLMPAIVRGAGIYIGNITTVEISDNEIKDNTNTRTQAPHVISADPDIALYRVGKAVDEKNVKSGNTVYVEPKTCLTRSMAYPKGSHRFTVGDIQCIALCDGTLAYPTGDALGFLFGGTPRELLAGPLQEHNFPKDLWSGTYTCLYVDTGKNKVLIDTGAAHAGASVGRIMDALAAEGIKAEDIDTVVLTHCHPDHTAGNVDIVGKPLFTRAKYVMSKAEWDFWTSGPTLAEWPAPDMLKRNLGIYNGSQVPLIEDVVKLVDGEAEIVPGVTAVPTPGHTPGHISVRIDSGKNTLLYLSDAVLHPIHMEHPDWFSIMDYDPKKTLESRKSVLAWAADTKALAMVFHCDFPSLGYIVKKGEAWRWQAVEAS